MPAAGQLHVQSSRLRLPFIIRSFGIHIKVHKLSKTQRPRTIHTCHDTVDRLGCRLQACREVQGSGAQLCWLLHSCASVMCMTAATRGGVSTARGGWQPSIHSVSNSPGRTDAGGGGVCDNSHSWGQGTGSGSSRHRDNGTPGDGLGLLASVSQRWCIHCDRCDLRDLLCAQLDTRTEATEHPRRGGLGAGALTCMGIKVSRRCCLWTSWPKVSLTACLICLC